jgi:PadR family transcriptional regulator PadR
MNAQFKRGIVELCVLSELALEDMYGYMIINNISKHLDVNENTIYPIMRRLTKEG